MAKEERWEILKEKNNWTNEEICKHLCLESIYLNIIIVIILSKWKLNICTQQHVPSGQDDRHHKPSIPSQPRLIPMSYIFVSQIHMLRNGFVSKTNLMSTKCVRSLIRCIHDTAHGTHSENGRIQPSSAQYNTTAMLKFKSNSTVSYSRCLVIVLIAINNGQRCEPEREWNMAIKFTVSPVAWLVQFLSVTKASQHLSQKRWNDREAGSSTADTESVN